jgi:hypothetical protein
MNALHILLTLTRATAASVALLGLAAHAEIETPALEQIDEQTIEHAFWDCDARATVEVLPTGDAVLCAMLGDELKQRRFDGDFAAMLDWWRANKQREHALRAPPGESRDLALDAP